MAQNPPLKKSRRRYSESQVNRAIDTILHPLFGQSNAFIVVDTVLHGLMEQDFKLTVRKFTRYALPKILDEILDSH